MFDLLLTNKSTGFQFLTNKIFEKQFNHKREPKEQGILILDIVINGHTQGVHTQLPNSALSNVILNSKLLSINYLISVLAFSQSAIFW